MSKRKERTKKFHKIYSVDMNLSLRKEYRKLMDWPKRFELNANAYTLWLEQKIVELQNKLKGR